MHILDRIKNAVLVVQSAYKETFRHPTAEIVLKDLALFCRASTSTYAVDAREHAVLEGRRQVWLRIERMVKLSPDEVIELRIGRGDTTGEE